MNGQDNLILSQVRRKHSQTFLVHFLLRNRFASDILNEWVRFRIESNWKVIKGLEEPEEWWTKALLFRFCCFLFSERLRSSTMFQNFVQNFLLLNVEKRFSLSSFRRYKKKNFVAKRLEFGNVFLENKTRRKNIDVWTSDFQCCSNSSVVWEKNRYERRVFLSKIVIFHC